MGNSAQGTITIRRLRNGDTIFITMKNNGKALYQAVDRQTGAVAPDWTVAANQPKLTPSASTARKQTVTMQNHTWIYNETTLTFGAADSEGWQTSTNGTPVGAFKFNQKTGELKIVKNLASVTNYANDTLNYKVQCVVGGIEYTIEKSFTIEIHDAGSSSYSGRIEATSNTISEKEPEVELSAILSLGLVDKAASEYSVQWYCNSEPMNDTSKTITVDRDMVNGVSLFIAEFTPSGSSTPVATAGIAITDMSDEYYVKYEITSANDQVDVGKPVTVTGKVWNFTTNSEVTLPSTAVWETCCYRLGSNDTYEAEKTEESNEIEITTEQTDVTNSDGTTEQRDVIVSGGVTWG